MQESRIERTVKWFEQNDKNEWVTINNLIDLIIKKEDGYNELSEKRKAHITVQYVQDFMLSELFVYKRKGKNFIWNLKYREPITNAAYAAEIEVEALDDSNEEEIVDEDEELNEDSPNEDK